MEKTEIIAEQQVLETAPELATWIEEELGDTELAEFLRAHPEGKELLLSGETLLPRTVFDVVSDLDEVAPALASELRQTIFHEGMLPKVSYESSIGNLSEEEASRSQLDHRYPIALDHLMLGEGESEKTAHDRLCIHEANEGLNRLRKKFGLPAFIAQDESCHIVPGSSKDLILNSGGKMGGVFSPVAQASYISDDSPDAVRVDTIFHEHTHFLSYCAIQADRRSSGDIHADAYRSGLSVVGRQREGSVSQMYLRSLNEAVTEETAQRLCFEIPPESKLYPYAEYRQWLAHHVESGHAEMLKKNLLRPEWVINHEEEEEKDKKGRVGHFSCSYTEDRKMMFAMLNVIAERNPELFGQKSPDEAEEELFEMLQKAMFTGNILPFGRLFNDTFGRGKFREFGHLQTVEEQQRFIDEL